jgi:hypothetical protein
VPEAQSQLFVTQQIIATITTLRLFKKNET